MLPCLPAAVVTSYVVVAGVRVVVTDHPVAACRHSTLGVEVTPILFLFLFALLCGQVGKPAIGDGVPALPSLAEGGAMLYHHVIGSLNVTFPCIWDRRNVIRRLGHFPPFAVPSSAAAPRPVIFPVTTARRSPSGRGMHEVT